MNKPQVKKHRLTRGLVWTVPLLVAAVVSTACSDTGASTAGASATGEIVVVTPDQASNVVRDYGYTAGTDNQDVTNNLHAQLIRKPYVEEEGSDALVQDYYNFEPYLAESYDVSPDQLVYTFHLKQGVLSQQGNELNADDVLWSFERKFATPGGGMAGYFKPMLTDPDTQIQKIDDYTVSFSTAKAGYGLTLLANLAENIGSIYDSDYLIQNSTPEDPYAVAWGAEDMMRGNFGYGAYQLESVTPGQEIVMAANPNFVLGEPEVERIVRRVVADPATRANMVTRGDADIALALRSSDQAALQSDDAVTVPTTTSNQYLLYSMNTTTAPFDDVRVRQAMAYAIPYDQIMENVFFGRAYKYNHVLDDKAPNWDGADLPDYEGDPQRAREMLAAAGLPDGFAFTLSVNNQLPAAQDTAIQIQSFAAEAGIDVTIAEVPAAQLNADQLAGKVQASLSLGASVTMTPPYSLQLLTQPGGGSNYALWNDPEFLAMMDQGLDAGDALSPEAGEFWNAAELRMTEQAPYIFIARVRPTVAMEKGMGGYVQRTDFRIDYSNLTLS
ncbi:ABC transporter substrate-binding protein [Rhodococcoides trifolii]|uniref:ABC transporter substrate-binding protein n=1 Tax=Rhodococcoides trifolii TaxID=908250 RepID=A0A917LGM3_9NOCA|nr:ABC transporter substrate-binding protein [Rhodococcus trifolii]GGG21157.1 ABC transporter substrate-binding protein [Rhodococcus trifolii]